ncbi:MAG: protein-glutamate O-methyltransferase CheR [Pseudomonadota bacterium]|nr:protein-glutamate O-methyltransferase CheR [Pseudomonadota bacterium]MDE3037669.1 protein-glutamate O-methyltransferase CheR [Pseudomonadota bacterium]
MGEDQTPQQVRGLEIDLLLAGIQKRYGYDFTHYSRASLLRRLEKAREHAKTTRFTELLDKLLHDKKCFDEFLKYMSITVTEMFRDPLFYKAVRQHVVPVLKTFPFVKIWHAGSATGEEVYSMAILLHEEGFLDRARIYATDFNKYSLDTAENGVYPAKHIETYAANYRESGGTRDFSEYYSDGYELTKFRDFLKERITFSYHNLVTDGVFGEMNLICCRNVLIYFDKTLQERTLSKFTDSLRHGGFLCLGNKESLNFTAAKKQFETVDSKQRIYKKCGAIHAI